MFGYVVANRDRLTDAQRERYQGCYCGLCHSLGERYGSLQRAALNYDMTFLVLLLSSLYEPEETASSARCSVHPLRSHSFWQTEVTTYAADMNIALAYHNCMDDWHDDKAWKSLLLAGLFRSGAHRVRTGYPTQWNAITCCLDRLKEIEAVDLQDPDAGANAFGDLMGTLFSWRDDRWSPVLRQLGSALGRFIYLMDAVMDLEADLKNGSYNPFRSRAETGLTPEDLRPVLRLLIGECADAFERLPLVQDLDLLRNILYSGVWCRFPKKEKRTGKEVQNHV